ncbi:hypothetical protein EYC84_006713 [Monilinia fructicola]|uniref:Uncharacterized protein n=1 Tax=Monilinia fructicola TaxID=38448 RepID=A0A5M9K6Y6_MONFR|nr:hypothetical protein EYC84_006713 [Monilinia fructicola]
MLLPIPLPNPLPIATPNRQHHTTPHHTHQSKAKQSPHQPPNPFVAHLSVQTGSPLPSIIVPRFPSAKKSTGRRGRKGQNRTRSCHHHIVMTWTWHKHGMSTEVGRQVAWWSDRELQSGAAASERGFSPSQPSASAGPSSEPGFS